MKDETKTIEQLLSEINQLRERVQELEALEAVQEQTEAELLGLISETEAVFLALPDTFIRIFNDDNLQDSKTRERFDWQYFQHHYLSSHLTPENSAVIVEELKAIQKTVLATGTSDNHEYEVPTEEGSVWYEAQFTSLVQDEVMMVIRDITHRKQVEANAINLALKQKSIAMLQTFISHASHDLRTPLTIIQSSLDLLKMTNDSQRQKRHLDKIQTHTDKLNKIINDMLVMVRMDSLETVDFVQLDVNYVIESVLQMLMTLAEAKHIQISLALDTSIPQIPANEAELYRALTNVIENAIVYTTEGGNITVRTQQRHDYVEVVIADNGIGMAEADTKQIFERFYRADTARDINTGGTGLGLSIVKKVVELHGGEITVKSELQKGSTFTLCFPIIAS